MNKIEEVFVNGDVINVKKGIFGWTVVYPLKNKDGTWNWFNIITGGNWIKFIMLIVFILLVVGFLIEYGSNMEVCQNAITELNELKGLRW